MTSESKLRHQLASRELVVVAGKGGVGKSAVAATLSRLLATGAATGGGPRRVLALEIDPRENLHQLLDVPPSGGALVDAGGGLSLQNLQATAVMDRIVVERLKIEAVARRVLDSPVYQQFAQGAPGLKEVAVLGHALRLVRGVDPVARAEPFDLVVLDAPATGHGISLLTAPGLLADVIEQGPFGDMGAELAEWMADPSRVGVVVVTSPEEMPVQEALELEERLRRELGRGAELLVVNGIYAPVPADLGAGPNGASDEGERRLLDLWARRRGLQEREIERLEGAWEGAIAHLPRLALDRGPQLVAALGHCLDRELAREFAA